MPGNFVDQDFSANASTVGYPPVSGAGGATSYGGGSTGKVNQGHQSSAHPPNSGTHIENGQSHQKPQSCPSQQSQHSYGVAAEPDYGGNQGQHHAGAPPLRRGENESYYNPQGATGVPVPGSFPPPGTQQQPYYPPPPAQGYGHQVEGHGHQEYGQPPPTHAHPQAHYEHGPTGTDGPYPAYAAQQNTYYPPPPLPPKQGHGYPEQSYGGYPNQAHGQQEYSHGGHHQPALTPHPQSHSESGKDKVRHFVSLADIRRNMDTTIMFRMICLLYNTICRMPVEGATHVTKRKSMKNTRRKSIR